MKAKNLTPAKEKFEISLPLRILSGIAYFLALYLLAGCSPLGEKLATPGFHASNQPTAAIPLSPEVRPALPAGVISGTVTDDQGPVAGATVRIQAGVNETLTNQSGSFSLSNLEDDKVVTVSAWKAGYYCARAEGVAPPAGEISLKLVKYQTTDNPDYAWVPPEGEVSCYSCKAAVTQVWLDNDAHGKSSQNPRFLSMYFGTDLDKNQSPPTRFVNNRDYGRVPIPPDLSQPYYGPGYKLDFPDSAGNCAACHIPGAALEDPYGINPEMVSGVDHYGIHCDFCHKIADVRLNPVEIPYANMPGVLSMDVRRPFPDDPLRYQLFFGTFDDDNVPAEDTYLPLIEESQFCAPCHFGVFWDTVVYNSYGEWLASPYSDPQTGKTCQQCHMPAPTVLDGKEITNVAPGLGGVQRDPLSIHAHTFPGAADQALLQNAVTMDVQTILEGDALKVDVSISNDLTGHDVPTDSPLRHLILVVRASDSQGIFLEQLEGPVIPEWGGVGDPEEGYYAGLPGKAYAKVLTEFWTEISPSGAYWNPTTIESDNRLAAFETDRSLYRFALPEQGEIQLEVALVYRRAFREISDQKGWNVPDIVMEEYLLQLE